MALPTVSAARVRMVATATSSAWLGTNAAMVGDGEERERAGREAKGDEDATKYSLEFPDCYLITPSESGTVTEDLPH